MAAEAHQARATDEPQQPIMLLSLLETDQSPLREAQLERCKDVDASVSTPHAGQINMNSGTSPAPGPGPRVRERRLSSTPSSSSQSQEVGAPSVWTTPDWAGHPVIENYYGHARRSRVNSFYEIMQSPTNTVATRTLAENCNSYDNTVESDDGHVEDGVHNGRKHAGNARAIAQPTRKLGSFSYSYTTETSDDGVTPSPSFSTSTNDSGYDAPRVHMTTATISTVGRRRPRRRNSGETAHAARVKLVGSGGYADWNRQRQQQNATTDMVPIPHNPNGRLKKPTQEAVHNLSRRSRHTHENPQGGHQAHVLDDLSPRNLSSGLHPDSPLNPVTTRPALTTSRLKNKLLDCLLQIDDRIDVEISMTRDAHACMRRSTRASVVTKRESLMWSLLCGARTSSHGGHGAGTFDAIDSIHDRLAVALHHRALNQLQRHRRHVNGILQIVTSHNPDLHLTEKQLDSFESADSMLANDVKYAMLQKQVEALATTRKKRVEALRDAKIKNGRDCFESPHIKSAMLSKLLEAVSWYRLVQTNARDESASTSVGLAVDENDGADAEDGSLRREGSLGSGSSGSSSSISASRSLQELQVEKILSVLAGEEFYSDYNELMCQPDWWEIAQAHFENVIFSKAESRVCQWVSRVSKDVATVSFEPLEDEDSYRLVEERKAGSKKAQQETLPQEQQFPAEWTKDPQPEQIIEFIDRLTRRIRKEFDVPSEVTKSLNAFIQRAVFPRIGLLCFNQKTIIDCQRKDKLWRKRCMELSGIPLENLSLSADLAGKIRSMLPSRRVSGGRRAYLIRAIDAFNCMSSVVPCDLLDELMYGVVILHHEAALVLGTTQFSVETFFPLLSYVLLHCNLPTIHAQLHLLENYAITNSNVNGEESYYVYCVHAAIEYVCNSAGLSTVTPAPAKPKEEAKDADSDDQLEQKRDPAVPLEVSTDHE